MEITNTKELKELTKNFETLTKLYDKFLEEQKKLREGLDNVEDILYDIRNK
jgi:molybdopterin converting factor small subunit